jgi:hypothetical protein
VKHQQDVSASALGEWEKELMEDPKVASINERVKLNANSHRTASLWQP